MELQVEKWTVLSDDAEKWPPFTAVCLLSTVALLVHCIILYYITFDVDKSMHYWRKYAIESDFFFVVVFVAFIHHRLPFDEVVNGVWPSFMSSYFLTFFPPFFYLKKKKNFVNFLFKY